MSGVDLKRRWIYKGSETIPPCREGIYWNVIETIYPVTNADLARVTDKLKSMFGSTTISNNRMIRPINLHATSFVGARHLSAL